MTSRADFLGAKLFTEYILLYYKKFDNNGYYCNKNVFFPCRMEYQLIFLLSVDFVRTIHTILIELRDFSILITCSILNIFNRNFHNFHML